MHSNLPPGNLESLFLAEFDLNHLATAASVYVFGIHSSILCLLLQAAFLCFFVYVWLILIIGARVHLHSTGTAFIVIVVMIMHFSGLGLQLELKNSKSGISNNYVKYDIKN